MESEQFVKMAPGLPYPVLYGATGLLAALMLFAVWRAKSWSARFIIFAIWIRYILSAFHHITYQRIVSGLSINAVGSVAVVFLGILTVQRRHLLQPFFIGCYLMIGMIILSGVVNNEVSGMITAATKYGYFLVIAVSLYEALGKSGERNVLPLLLTSFAPLLLLQALSVALGVAKPGEDGGATSYIGGFDHEAAFSIAVASCLLMACFARTLPMLVRYGLVLISLAGIYVANYRTAILGIGPLVFAFFGLPALTHFYREQRAPIRLAVVLVGIVGIALAAFVLRERFADLEGVFADPGQLFGPPESFTRAERGLMSGRAYIWSNYIYGYLRGTDLQHVLGFGPETWNGVFRVYAHNTLVSYLYEYGWLGVATVLYFWGSMLYFAMKVEGEHRVNLIAAHLSFFLLNMATMPVWQIEGNIFYGLLCGFTLYQLRQTQARRARAEAVQAASDRPAFEPAAAQGATGA